MVVGKPDGVQLHHHLAHDVRDPLIGRTPPDAGHPFPEDGGIDERVFPDRATDAGVFLGNLPHRLMRNQGDFAGRQRCHAVVHRFEQEALRVEYVAGDVEREDLALAVLKHLVSEDHSFEEQVAVGGLLALSDDVLVSPEFQSARARALQQVLFLGTKRKELLQLADQWIGWGAGHRSSFAGGSASGLSATGAYVVRLPMMGLTYAYSGEIANNKKSSVVGQFEICGA